jgi:hypothetical protein
MNHSKEPASPFTWGCRLFDYIRLTAATSASLSTVTPAAPAPNTEAPMLNVPLEELQFYTPKQRNAKEAPGT